jgi:hypothetical protein
VQRARGAFARSKCMSNLIEMFFFPFVPDSVDVKKDETDCNQVKAKNQANAKI